MKNLLLFRTLTSSVVISIFVFGLLANNQLCAQAQSDDQNMVNAAPLVLTKENLIQELNAAKSISRGFVSALGYLVARQDNMPLLHTLVSDVAERLHNPVPLILVFKGNGFSQFAEEFGIDLRCNAMAMSLTPSKALICIGEDLIEKGLSLKELVAIIAHECSHIKKNHSMKALGVSIGTLWLCKLIILMMNGEPVVSADIRLQWGSPAGIVYTGAPGPRYFFAKGLVGSGLVMIVKNFYSRLCEKEADLTAAAIFEDPTVISDAVYAIEDIYREKPRLIDHVVTLLCSHPLTKDRKKYLEKYKNEREQEQVEAVATGSAPAA